MRELYESKPIKEHDITTADGKRTIHAAKYGKGKIPVIVVHGGPGAASLEDYAGTLIQTNIRSFFMINEIVENPLIQAAWNTIQRSIISKILKPCDNIFLATKKS